MLFDKDGLDDKVPVAQPSELAIVIGLVMALLTILLSEARTINALTYNVPE